MKWWVRVGLIALLLAVLAALYLAYPWLTTRSSRGPRLWQFFDDPAAHSDWVVRAGQRCRLPQGGPAPFFMPTDGYIGFIWGDSFRPGHSHQGLDIFGGGEPGLTPVYAAYAGYLTRLADWKSSLIVRVPQDPLHPERQVWLYYTHLADAQGSSFIVSEFPAGVSEVYVEAQTLLGYQGNYSGNALSPTGLHLHFSIVLDQGPSAEHPLGWFENELEIGNTLDPSPYLGLPLNAKDNRNQIPVCAEEWSF